MAGDGDDLPEPRNVALRSDDVPEPPTNPEWTSGLIGSYRKREVGVTFAIEAFGTEGAVIEAAPDSYIALDDAE